MAAGTSFGNLSDRICGSCRVGYELKNDACHNIALGDIVQEVFAPSNLPSLTGAALEAVHFHEQTRYTLRQIILLTKKIANVCLPELSLSVHL